MINVAKYEFIKEKYGLVASWAIWADEGLKPTDNVGDLRVFDANLEKLQLEYVLVGLNVARPVEIPFANFHDSRTIAKDYKLRHALKDTPIWGAYMTDVIKNLVDKDSNSVEQILKLNPNIELENIASLRSELNEVGSMNPILVALGRRTHRILVRHLRVKYKIVYVPHYSIYMGKDHYRQEVLKALGFERNNETAGYSAVKPNERRKRSKMKIRENGSGRDLDFYPHTVRANGMTCPQYVEFGNCQSCDVVIDNANSKFHVWTKLTSERVNFEINGQWYFIDDAVLNRDVRSRRVAGRRYETNP